MLWQLRRLDKTLDPTSDRLFKSCYFLSVSSLVDAFTCHFDLPFFPDDADLTCDGSAPFSHHVISVCFNADILSMTKMRGLVDPFSFQNFQWASRLHLGCRKSFHHHKSTREYCPPT